MDAVPDLFKGATAWSIVVLLALVSSPVLAALTVAFAWASAPLLLFAFIGVGLSISFFLGMLVYGGIAYGFHLHDVNPALGYMLTPDPNLQNSVAHPGVPHCQWLLVQDTYCAPTRLITSISHLCSSRGSTQRALLASTAFAAWAMGFLATAKAYELFPDPGLRLKLSTAFSFIGFNGMFALANYETIAEPSDETLPDEVKEVVLSQAWRGNLHVFGFGLYVFTYAAMLTANTSRWVNCDGNESRIRGANVAAAAIGLVHLVLFMGLKRRYTSRHPYNAALSAVFLGAEALALVMPLVAHLMYWLRLAYSTHSCGGFAVAFVAVTSATPVVVWALMALLCTCGLRPARPPAAPVVGGARPFSEDVRSPRAKSTFVIRERSPSQKEDVREVH